MSNVFVLSIMIITHAMKNYWIQTVLFQYITGIYSSLQQKCLRVYAGSVRNILNEVFPLNPESSYSLRNQQKFATRPIHTVHYASNLLSYKGLIICEMVPSDLKNWGTMKAFKFAIKMLATRELPLYEQINK